MQQQYLNSVFLKPFQFLSSYLQGILIGSGSTHLSFCKEKHKRQHRKFAIWKIKRQINPFIIRVENNGKDEGVYSGWIWGGSSSTLVVLATILTSVKNSVYQIGIIHILSILDFGVWFLIRTAWGFIIFSVKKHTQAPSWDTASCDG